MYIQICIYTKEHRDEKQNNKQDHPDDSGGKAKIRVLRRKMGKTETEILIAGVNNYYAAVQKALAVQKNQ